MAERYFWTPWDVDDQGTLVWPRDFETIQRQWKSDPSPQSTHSIHSIDGIGRLIVVSGPDGYVADHESIPEVVDLGDTLTRARAWIETGAHRRAREFLSHFEKTMAPLRKVDPSDKTSLLARFLPDQLTGRKTSGRRGTFNETWTGTDDDPWPSVWTTTLMDTLDRFGGVPSDYDRDILSNAGRVAVSTGGALRQAGATHTYTDEQATDMNVAFKTVERRVSGPAVRTEVGGGFDSFYYAVTHNLSGHDTRMYRVVDESRSEIASANHGNNTDPRWQRLVIENDGSGDPALDYTEWLTTVSEPGTPTLSHTDTDASAITGSGHSGIFDNVRRSWTSRYDDFEFTDNDAPGGGTAPVRRNLGSLGVGR